MNATQKVYMQGGLAAANPSPFSLLPILKLQPDKYITLVHNLRHSVTAWCKNGSEGDYSGVFDVAPRRKCKRKREEYELTPQQMKKKYMTP